MRAIRIAAILTLALVPAAFAQNGSDAAKAAATITQTDVKKHIAFLASDSLQGRDTPSPGLDMAAKYAADHFKSLGLKPAGDAGDYIQRWPYSAKKLDASKVEAALQRNGDQKRIVIGSEYFVIPSVMTDTLVGEILLAGVATPQTKGNAAYRGNIVAFHLPGADLNQVWQQNAQAAVIAGMTSGARGVVLILDPEFDQADVGMTATAIASQQLPLPVVGIRNDVARAWLKGTAADMDVAQAADTVAKAIAGASVRVRTAMSGSSAAAPNIAGILEGSDPALKDTYVVYSAHIDHVGVGRPDAEGDSIYNGADDDASGTTAVLEVAEAFASMKQRPKRSIIFLLVSGEEKGLFGSRHFVNNPPVPVEKMVANINIDMIGRNASDSTVAIGQEYTSLGTTVQTVAKAHPELKLTVAPDLWPQENLFVRSDHYNFAMKKIPAIFFTSGLHADYHKPSDEPETIDNDKLARTAQLVFWLGNDVANSTTVPTWTDAGLKVIGGAK